MSTSAAPPPATDPRQPTISARAPLPRTVRLLAWLHFWNDLTLDFLTPLLPATVPAALIGAMEGAADGTAQVLKLFSGRRADASGRRAVWVASGYGINALVRPLTAVGIALGWPAWAMACRLGDRVGKGVRGSATDALVGDWTTEDQRARAFALMRTLDNLGATGGALLAALVTFLWPHGVVWAVAALAVPAVAMVWASRALQDAPAEAPASGVSPSARASASAAKLGWWPRAPGLGLPLALIGLASFGQLKPLFVLVAAGLAMSARWPLWMTCLCWAGLSLVQAACAALAGVATDRLGPRAFLTVGWLAGAAALAALASCHGWALVAAALAFGALAGFTEGAEKTLLAALAPKSERARTYGAFGVIAAVCTLAGNAGLGWAFARIGAPAFAFAAAVLVIAALGMAATVRTPTSR